jgi:CheY-like chemotaxis protein
MAKIMLIEDSPDTRDLVKMVLEMNDHSVLSAETGEAAIVALKEFQPDLILMDISLPGKLNGLDIVRKLRADSAFDETPILALTAHAMPQDQKKSLDAGCDEHITKPILDLESFSEKVSLYAAKGRSAKHEAVVSS